MEKTQSIWEDLNMSYSYMREYKDSKISQSKYVEPYWQSVLEKLDAKKDFYFPGELSN